MNARIARPAAWLLALLLVAALAVVPRSAFSQDKGAKGGDDDKEMAGKDKDKGDKSDKADAEDAKADADDKPDGKGGRAAKDSKDPQAKIYLLKSQKKAKLNGAEVLSLVLQDVFTGKTETMFVPNSDPKGREYDPLPDVAAAVEALEDGAPVTVEAAKERGKWMVSSLAKADVQPGEELPNGYVFVEYDEKEDKRGNKACVVTLRKFGREVKVGVPMFKNDEYKDANLEPDPKIDRQLQQLQAGDTVEATVKPGRPPMLVEIYRMYPPERGKFVGLKETRYDGAAAAGFEMLAADGTTVTITLDGKMLERGDKKTLMPYPKMLSAVKKIKPDTEIIVYYREDGSTMFLRDIKFPKSADKADKAGAGEKDKMKPEDDKADADKPDADKPAKGDDDKKDKK